MKTDANILIVDLEKIRNNIKILKNHTGKKFYAVVKADAYGLGAKEIARNIESLVDGFCVANINEAIELRQAGISKEILMLGYICPENYPDIYRYDLSLTIYNYQIAEELNKLGHPIKVHIKIETGHNRLGFQNTEDHIGEIIKISKMENIHIVGIFTHLSTADEEDKSYTLKQEAIFAEVLKKLKPISDHIIKHISNDAAAIAYDFTGKYDAIRSGISMYGVYPSAYIKDSYKLNIEESFQLESRVSNVKFIEKGEGVSYGREYVADGHIKIATISIGYADGYHRLISKQGYVLINGQKAKILGRITMDQMMVDVTGLDIKIHDKVVLIGKSGDLEINVDQVAQWAQTISYEIMTSISARVERLYINEE